MLDGGSFRCLDSVRFQSQGIEFVFLEDLRLFSPPLVSLRRGSSMCFIGKKEKGISFAAGSFREFLIIERKMSEELAVCSLRWDLVSGFPRFVLVLDFFE